MLKFVSIVALALLSGIALAQPVQQSFVNKDGEYLIVESQESSIALPAVVTAIEKAGHTRRTTSDLPPGTKTDTRCKVKIYTERDIRVECYSPRYGYGVSVYDHLWWSREEFKGDYSGVIPMITKLRGDQRRASQALNPPVLIVPTF